MNRATFLKTTGILAAGSLFGPSNVLSKSSETVVKILHTNDTHARIDPFPENHPRYPGMGGIAKRAAVIAQRRKVHEHILLLDSGDVFQGTPYFNKFKGHLDYQLMSQMGYDASTFGNHEFDNGMEGLMSALPHASFPMVSSNYDFGKYKNDRILPYKIIKKGEVKIGIFGLGIDFENLVLPSLHDGVYYRHPFSIAHAMVRTLKKYQQCTYVICLSHLGYEYSDEKRPSDVRLAREVLGIDLILGGHTHTFMEYPDVVEHSDGNITLIHQVGFGGIWLGEIDITFTRLGVKELPTSTSINIS